MKTLLIIAALLLCGCRATLWSYEWMSQAQCDALPETAARGIAECARYDYKESQP